MQAEVDILGRGRDERVVLNGTRCTVGSAAENDICLGADTSVSRLHAVFECFSAGWTITDLGSSNGTFLNGERLWSSAALRHGDELRLGRTRLLFRNTAEVGRPLTTADESPPGLTPRERDVLIALCRPLLARDLFTEPASTKAIAAELVVTEAAVKQHLANLFNKFAVDESDPHRRVTLANHALRRGAVSIADLRGPPA